MLDARARFPATALSLRSRAPPAAGSRAARAARRAALARRDARPAGRSTSRLPRPEAFLGYPLGARFTSWDRIVAYLEALDAASPRVKMWEYGQHLRGAAAEAARRLHPGEPGAPGGDPQGRTSASPIPARSSAGEREPHRRAARRWSSGSPTASTATSPPRPRRPWARPTCSPPAQGETAEMLKDVGRADRSAVRTRTAASATSTATSSGGATRPTRAAPPPSTASPGRAGGRTTT